MTSEGLGEMFEGDSADMRAGKFPLVLMGGRAEDLACADPGARTPIGLSGNFKTVPETINIYGKLLLVPIGILASRSVQASPLSSQSTPEKIFRQTCLREGDKKVLVPFFWGGGGGVPPKIRRPSKIL